MPELPEVEVVRAGLAPALTGAVVTGVEIFDARALTRHHGTQADFVRKLTGARVMGAVRRGKFLWFPFQIAGSKTSLPPRFALLGHLGMSGQILLRSVEAEPARHTRVRFSIDSPDHGEIIVDFDDQRTFGSLAVDTLIPTSDGLPAGFDNGGSELDRSAQILIPAQVSHIARDALDPAVTSALFREVLGAKRSAIKRTLLDQNLVSGIGNIYADESLWAARINPEQPALTISRAKFTSLFDAVQLVLARALAEGGTSFDAQYVNVNGQSGYFAHSLNVYGQQGKPCSRCGTTIVRAAFMNRSSHYCPRCQRY